MPRKRRTSSARWPLGAHVRNSAAQARTHGFWTAHAACRAQHSTTRNRRQTQQVVTVEAVGSATLDQSTVARFIASRRLRQLAFSTAHACAAQHDARARAQTHACSAPADPRACALSQTLPRFTRSLRQLVHRFGWSAAAESASPLSASTSKRVRPKPTLGFLQT